jgi:glycine/D-amino acid oxidase-like deaminating enzyme
VGSYWLLEDAPARAAVTLDGPPDVVVVGGGVTGCSCALELARRGLRVRLYEARTVAGGASGRNGGFALRGGAMPYQDAVRDLGHDAAHAFWRLSERALDIIETLAGDALRRVGSFKLAVDDEELEELRIEATALKRDGFDVEWLDELSEPLAGLFAGGYRHPRDGSLQPARWVRRLAAHAAAAGVEIHEHQRIDSLDGIDATVVLATDGYTHGLVPELDAVIQPTRGQVLVTEPLDRELFPEPHYARYGYDYWQQLPDGRLVMGGERDASLDEEATAEEGTTDVVQGRLEEAVARLTGSRPAIEHRWSGIWGTTPDLLPLAGPVPGRPHTWVAAGYSGHGNVLGFAFGRLVGAAVDGDVDPVLGTFEPARFLVAD